MCFQFGRGQCRIDGNLARHRSKCFTAFTGGDTLLVGNSTDTMTWQFGRILRENSRSFIRLSGELPCAGSRKSNTLR